MTLSRSVELQRAVYPAIVAALATASAAGGQVHVYSTPPDTAPGELFVRLDAFRSDPLAIRDSGQSVHRFEVHVFDPRSDAGGRSQVVVAEVMALADTALRALRVAGAPVVPGPSSITIDDADGVVVHGRTVYSVHL